MNWLQKNIADWVGLDKFVNPIHFERYSSQFIDPYADYNDFSDDITKLKEIFSSPAALKVFQLCCNMMSMAKVYVYKDEKEQPNDPLLDRLKKPNPMQTRSQWLWDFMFWKMIGNAYGYIDSKVATNVDNKMYWLDSSKMELPQEMLNKRDFIFLSKAAVDGIKNQNVKYIYKSGETTSFKWGRIIHITDLSNGTGNWFRGKSKVDALYKIICNSNHAIDSKNINVRYAGKFMVAGKADPNNVSQLPMGEGEQQDIETKMNGRKSVHAVKSMIDIKRFVEQAAIIGELDESYLSDYFKIGSLYDIPKDVLEAFNSSTFENQEKARGAFISYCLSPSAENLATELENYFEYTDREIVFDWEHLPFMQVFAKERAETGFKVTQSLLNLVRVGVPIEEINRILDLKLTKLDYEAVKGTTVTGQAGAGEGENNQ